jgi:hypothetical protein
MCVDVCMGVCVICMHVRVCSFILVLTHYASHTQNTQGILKAAEEGKLKPVRFNDLMSTEVM